MDILNLVRFLDIQKWILGYPLFNFWISVNRFIDIKNKAENWISENRIFDGTTDSNSDYVVQVRYIYIPCDTSDLVRPSAWEDSDVENSRHPI